VLKKKAHVQHCYHQYAQVEDDFDGRGVFLNMLIATWEKEN